MSKTIEFKSNYGNFDYRMTAVVGDEVNEATTALCLQGLANICYRVAGSSVDKALGVKERKSVEYSDADGERINAAVSKKLTEMLAAEKTKVLAGLSMSFAVTGAHEFGAEEKGTKEATELWTVIQALPEDKFNEKLKVLGLDEDYTDETAIIAVAKALRDARKAASERLKSDMAGLGAVAK